MEKLYHVCIETDKEVEFMKTYARSKKGAWNAIWQVYKDRVESGDIKDFIIKNVALY